MNDLPRFLANKTLHVIRLPNNRQDIFIDLISQQGDLWGIFSEKKVSWGRVYG
jgi:hypothetical protein